MLGATNCAVGSSEIVDALADCRRAAETAVRQRIARGQLDGELANDADIDALTGLVTATL